MNDFHPELAAARFVPGVRYYNWSVRLLQTMPHREPPAPEDMLIENVTTDDGVLLRSYRPRALEGAAPALYWMHGGGYIQGFPMQDEARSIAMARELGITVVAVTYRLAPNHPAPAAIEDAYAGLAWLFAHAEERGIDPKRIAIGGGSAGAGLAAGLALYAHDRGEIAPAFQLLVYPMLDDRTVLRRDMNTRNVRFWTPQNNRFAWTVYLGTAPGAASVSPYAAPARRDDLSGLPPAWIGVGTLDLFHDEDVEYARRLTEAGVPCTLDVVEGAFHGFDVAFRKSDVVKQFWREQVEALRGALFD